ncbi:MAG: hypothetical protein MR923_11025 [Prevotella sp.]|nr:hypothetical protein [Prevotella sp.]
MLGLFFLGLFLSYHRISLPWQLSNVPYASFLVMTGNELAKCNKRLETPTRYWDILLLALCTLTISYFWRLDMAFNLITPIIPLTYLYDIPLVNVVGEKGQLVRQPLTTGG